MKNRSLACLAAALLVTPAAADLVFNGDFQAFRPGTNYTVTAELIDRGFVKAFGDNVPVERGLAVYSDDSSTGTVVDFPGWITVAGTPDMFHDSPVPDGSVAFNAFGQGFNGGTRAETAGAVGKVEPGVSYSITAAVGGPESEADGPITVPLVFELTANGVAISPSASVGVPLPHDETSWYTIRRTYDATDLAAFIGQDVKILIGTNDNDGTSGRVLFDNITFAAIPEPTPMPFLACCGLLVARRKSRKFSPHRGA